MAIIKKKYNSDQLEDFCDEYTESEIHCRSTNCNESSGTMDDVYGAAKQFFREGWRATKDNCYCPKCAKKKLKLTK